MSDIKGVVQKCLLSLLLFACSVNAILLPRHLSNDPRCIQCIYRYSHASKRFVDVNIKMRNFIPLVAAGGPLLQ